MGVKVEIKLYPDKIRALTDVVYTSAEQAAEAVKTQIKSDQVVPKQDGPLEDSAAVTRVSKYRFQVSFDTPYARRLYWNPQYNFRTDKNPNAQGLWMQQFIDGDQRNYFRDAFIARLRENGKGLIA